LKNPDQTDVGAGSTSEPSPPYSLNRSNPKIENVFKSDYFEKVHIEMSND